MIKSLFLATTILISSVSVTAADEIIGSYVALLSSRDHFNSKGKRLTKLWQIIRQDRANYHKFGKRDRYDQWDGFFKSKSNRAIAERMIQKGYIEPGLNKRVANGEVTVRVQIFGRGNVGTYLRVKVK